MNPTPFTLTACILNFWFLRPTQTVHRHQLPTINTSMHSALVNFDARFGTACDSQSLRKGQAGRDGGRDSLCALLRSDWAAQASISAFALTRCFSLLSVGVPSFPPCSPQPFKQHSKREAISSLQMGLVSFSKVIMPALAGTCVVSYAFWDLSRNRKLFGG